MHKCTQLCINTTKEIIQDIKDFEKKYPKYCKKCGGQGFTTDPGTQWEPPYSEQCDYCTIKGICPLCGQESIDEGCENCTNCEWDWDSTIVISEQIGCVCHEHY